MYLFISSLYMFRASHCSLSGDRIVSHPDRHTKQSLTQTVLIQFDLLMMNSLMLETYREVK